MSHAQNLRKHPLPTQRELARRFAYYPETGQLVTKRGPVGHVGQDGYVFVKYGCAKLRAHRIAFMLMENYWPDQVDHINGDRADNRWNNLREVTHAENVAYALERRHVSTRTLNGLYQFCFRENGKFKNVYFTLWRDAENFRREIVAHRKLHGALSAPPIPPKRERLKPEYRSKLKELRLPPVD